MKDALTILKWVQVDLEWARNRASEAGHKDEAHVFQMALESTSLSVARGTLAPLVHGWLGVDGAALPTWAPQVLRAYVALALVVPS